MNELINEYITNLKEDDIYKYCKNKNIYVTAEEVSIIYYYIKERNKDFFNNPYVIFNELKDKLSYGTYLKMIELYKKYSIFIK